MCFRQREVNIQMLYNFQSNASGYICPIQAEQAEEESHKEVDMLKEKSDLKGSSKPYYMKIMKYC